MIIATILLCNIIVFSTDEEGLYLFHAAILSLRVMQTQNDWSERSSQRRKGVKERRRDKTIEKHCVISENTEPVLHNHR